MVSATTKMWLKIIAWIFSIMSIVIVIITYISYNVVSGIPLGPEVILYWIFIILGLIYPVVYSLRMLFRQTRLTKRVSEVIKNNERISAYQAAKLLEEPLWLVKNVFKKWRNKSGVLVKLGGELVHFDEKVVNKIKKLYKETPDLGKISSELNKQKIVLKKKDIQIILDELLDRDDQDILEIEESRSRSTIKEEI
ncbi:MAG: hypothetical protein ACTSVE_01590 [Candidatus Helarchaeota archaeon]